MEQTWAERIADLEAAGWTLSSIGKEIDLSPQSLSDIKQGRSKAPNGMAAVKLYELHRDKSTPAEVRAA